MRRLTKEGFYKVLVGQFELDSITDNELKKAYLDNLNRIIDNLYDSSKDVVEPLSKEETYIFRKKYGIFDSGVCQSYASISREIDLSHEKVYSIVDIACRKIRNYSISYVKFPGVDVFDNDNCEKFDSILVVPIDRLDISVRSYNCLVNARVFTLGKLVGLSTKDLTKIRNLGAGCITEIIDRVHECGLKFTDEYDKKYGSEAISDREKLLMRYQILKEEEKIAQIKQTAFLNKVNRMSPVIKANYKKLIKEKNTKI